MSVKKDKSIFSHFFREDDKLIREVIQKDENPQDNSPSKEKQPPSIPVLPEVKSAGDSEMRNYWQKLRKFFSTGKKGSGLPDKLHPVVLSPQLTRSLVGLEFPVWINTGYPVKNELPISLSLYEMVNIAFNNIDPKRFNTSILQVNLERIVHIANEQLADQPAAIFTDTMDSVKTALADEIKMGEKDKKDLKDSLDEMSRKMPREGILLPFSSDLPYQLVEASMMALQEREREYLLEDIHSVSVKLQDLLQIEKEKGPEGKDPEKLRDSLGIAGSMVKADALSSYLPDTGSETMDPDRVQRIEKISKILEKAKETLRFRAYIVAEESEKKGNWKEIFETSEIISCKPGEGVKLIGETFEKLMPECTNLFAALRIAEMELDGQYHAEIHDEYFEQFSWENLSLEELKSCPFFILIANVEDLLNEENKDLGRLLHENLPIKYLGMKTRLTTQQTDGNTDLHSHDELTGMLLSHKNLFVNQVATITPAALVDNLEQGMANISPAFFHILDLESRDHNEAMVFSSAMIEARDFPGFTYSGLLGTPWGSRFDISNNPQSSQAWPEHMLTIQYPDGQEVDMSFSFTFADQAALFDDYKIYFEVVDPSYWTENLVPVDVYIDMHMEENIGKVPFIWMVDDENTLHKVAVNWQIIMAVEERRDQWRFLQENSGIHNFHVKNAIERVRKEMEESHAREIESLKEEYRNQIEKVRQEEAEKVMENLTNALLNLDLSSSAAMVEISRTPATEATEPASETADSGQEVTEEKPPVQEPVEQALTSEPYIDTMLCTTCNECIDINSQMFKYNADKLAYIADPRAGTYAELVEAAENCPVAIIHPGEPLDPNEKGLDELKARAKKFN